MRNGMNGRITITQGDCLELFDGIADGSVDAIITDPPFGISQDKREIDRSNASSPSMRRDSSVRLDFGEWDKFASRELFVDFTRKWMYHAARKLKDGGSFVSFFDQANISLLNWIGEECGIVTRTMFTWHKTNPVPSMQQCNYLSSCEWVFIGSKGKDWTFNFTKQNAMHNFFETANKSVYGLTDHPNEKPLALMEHFVKVHTREDDIVLDPFVGSGTTAVACHNTFRRFVGFERDEVYCAMAKKRVENAERSGVQQSLF